MSGIVGLFYLDGRPVDPVDLGKMTDILAHRGPDDAGVWYSGSVGLGHRMLWTTPESLQEQLPLANASGDLVITADARIDNREELIPQLGLADRPAGEITDSQLILAAYEKWGEQCPEKLLGDFAFAIWDGPRQTFFCARDHLGAKPFYYYQSDRLFVFASEIKALFCLSDVPRHLNELRVAFHLQMELISQDRAITFYQDVFRLPPAHSMMVAAHRARFEQYWSLDPVREVHLGSDDEYAEAFREQFSEAVRCRLRSAFPVGSTLSGGLDSSSITCMARDLLVRNGHEPLHTFSAVFDGIDRADERVFREAVVAEGNLVTHHTYPAESSPLIDLDRVFWHLDEAFFGPNYFIPWSLYRAAGDQGVRILLDGTDGDTTVSHGFDYLALLARTSQWSTFASEANAITEHFDDSKYATPLGVFYNHGAPYLSELTRQGRWIVLARDISEIQRLFGLSRRKLFLTYGLKPLMPEVVQGAWRSLRGRNNSTPGFNPIVNNNFAQQVALEKRFKDVNQMSPTLGQSARASHFHLITSGALPYSLELMNRISAAHSIEMRYPFCDRRLVEFCLALPPEQKLHGGWSRLVMRRAMANILPVEVQWRGGKAGLGPVYNRGMLRFERKLMDEVVLGNGGGLQEYVDMAVLRQVYKRYLSGKNSKDLLLVWEAVNLAVWLHQSGLRPRA